MDCEFPEDWDDAEPLEEETAWAEGEVEEAPEEDLSLLDASAEGFEPEDGAAEEDLASLEAADGLEEVAEEDLAALEAAALDSFEAPADEGPPVEAAPGFEASEVADAEEEEDLAALEAAACASFEEGPEDAEDLAALEAAACASFEAAPMEDAQPLEQEPAALAEEVPVGRRNVRVSPGSQKQFTRRNVPIPMPQGKAKGKGKSKVGAQLPPWKCSKLPIQAPKASIGAGKGSSHRASGYADMPVKGRSKGNPKGGPQGGKGGAKGKFELRKDPPGVKGKALGAGKDAPGAKVVPPRRPAPQLAEGPAAKRPRPAPEPEVAVAPAPAARTVTVKLRLPANVANKLQQLTVRGIKLKHDALTALAAAVPNDAAVLLQALLNRGHVENPSHFVTASLEKRNASVAAKAKAEGKAGGKNGKASDAAAGKNGHTGAKGGKARADKGGKSASQGVRWSAAAGQAGPELGRGQPPRKRKDLDFDRLAVQGKVQALNKQGLWPKRGQHPLDESALTALLRIEGARALEILDEVEAQGTGLADPSRYARELAAEEEQVHDDA